MCARVIRLGKCSLSAYGRRASGGMCVWRVAGSSESRKEGGEDGSVVNCGHPECETSRGSYNLIHGFFVIACSFALPLRLVYIPYVRYVHSLCLLVCACVSPSRFV